MSGSKISPAPWHTQPQGKLLFGSTGRIVFSPTGDHIIYSRQDDDSVQELAVVDGSHPEAAAVANIMAAAPDLLELLTVIRDADEDCKLDGLPRKMPDSIRASVDAAIARAEGRES